MSTAEHRGLLRPRDGDHARVSFAELFFDLIFVFAITQLSHSLIEHQTPMGFLEVGILFLAVWWTWIYTAWVTNWLDPERATVRLGLFVLMATGMVMAIAIPKAFGAHGALFAIAFASMQVMRPLFMVFAIRRHDPANHLNFVRITIWSSVAAVVWLWGGFAAPEVRLIIWAAALAIEYAGPAIGFYVPGLGASRSTDWTIEGSHVAERCGLFVILALGESILITGTSFARAEWSLPVLAGFGSALTGAIAMWWIYFNVGAERATQKIAQDRDPGRVARLAYTYLHLLIGAGIVLTAASDEFVLEHPTGHAEPLVALCILGGPMVYLFGNAVFKRVTGADWVPLSHLIGLALFIPLAFAWDRLDPVLLSLASTSVMMIVAVWETLSLRRSTPMPDEG